MDWDVAVAATKSRDPSWFIPEKIQIIGRKILQVLMRVAVPHRRRRRMHNSKMWWVGRIRFGDIDVGTYKFLL